MDISMINIKSGDILICRGKRAISKLIGKSTNSEATHTAVAMEIGGEMCVFDAQSYGCYPLKLEVWLHRWDYDFVIFRPNIVPHDVFMKRCVSYFGIKYDKRHLLLGFWRQIVFKKQVKPVFRANGKFVCSELSMKLLTNELDAENYSPQKVLQYMLNINLEPVYLRGSWFVN